MYIIITVRGHYIYFYTQEAILCSVLCFYLLKVKTPNMSKKSCTKNAGIHELHLNSSTYCTTNVMLHYVLF